MSGGVIADLGCFGEAWRRSRAFLFQPFRPGRYLAVAAIAFLASLGEGGCGGGMNFHMDAGGGPRGDEDGSSNPIETIRAAREVEAWLAWAKDHLAEIIAAAVAAFLVLALVGLALSFLSALFRFVFLRTCSEGRIAVASDCRRDAGRALGLFLFDLFLGLGVLAVALVAFAPPILLFVVAAAGGEGAAAPAMAIGGFLLLLLALAVVLAVALLAVLVQFVTRDLVVPLAAIERTGIVAAWRRLLGLLRAAPGASALYLVVRALAGGGLGMAEAVLSVILYLPALIPFFIYLFRSGEPSVGVVVGFIVLLVPYALGVKAVAVTVLLPARVWLRLAGPCALAPALAAGPPVARGEGFCGACGAPRAPGGRYCGRCGQPLP